MASTVITTNSSLTQKVWRPGLIHQAEVQSLGFGMVGKEDSNPIVLLEDLTKKRGDKIQIRFSPTDDTFDGFGEADQIEGSEEKLEFLSDEITIGYLAFAFSQASQLSQQRVNFDLKQAAFLKLTSKWRRRFDESIFNQLCGYTPVNSIAGYKRSGMQAVPTYDETHVVRNDAETADESLTTGDEMTLTLIDEVVKRVQSRAYMTDGNVIPPCSDGYYHLYLHPIQWAQIRSSTTAGQWYDITRAVLEGGKDYDSSGLNRGHLGTYNNVKMHVSDYVTQGVDSSTTTTAVTAVRRAPLVGARAAHIAFGEGYADGQHLDWVEQVRNYRTWGVLADSVYGIKRTEYNGKSWGSVIIPTYSPAT